jgi:hypothetical protein
LTNEPTALEAGDLIWTDSDPRTGREQKSQAKCEASTHWRGPVIRLGAAVPLTVLAEVRAKLSLLLGISQRL